MSDTPTGSTVEVDPVVDTGAWVRLTTGTSRQVPRHLRGLDAVVVRAVTHLAEDGATKVRYQTDDDVFLVRVRDTSEELEVTRAAFARTATSRLGLVSE